MNLPPMLDHDTTAYEAAFARIVAASRAWRGTRAARNAQRPVLTEIWDSLPDDPTYAIPRSVAAHLLADVQCDPHDELSWDLRSLSCLAPVWERVGDARAYDVARWCLPSIYLSLAEASRRCGDRPGAREYIRRAHLLSPTLLPGAYTDGLIAAIGAVMKRLDDSEPAPRR